MLQPLDPSSVAPSRMSVNLITVSSLQLVVSNLHFCQEFRGIRKTLPKISVVHTRMSSDYRASFFNVPHWHCMWKICSHRPLPQHQQQQLKNTSWSFSKCTMRHAATSQGQEDPTKEGQRAKCVSCLVNKCSVKWTRTCPTRCACVLCVMVFRWYCLLARNKHVFNFRCA